MSKMEEAETVYNEVVEATQERTSRLEEALFVGENFQQVMTEAMQALRSVQDNLLSQDTPGADSATLDEQLRELQVNSSLYCVVTCIDAWEQCQMMLNLTVSFVHCIV